MEDKVSYNVYLLNGELCKLEKIQSKPNIEINNYGYKLMGILCRNLEKPYILNDNTKIYPYINGIETPLVFDGKRMILMTHEQFINFTRERKLNFILK